MASLPAGVLRRRVLPSRTGPDRRCGHLRFVAAESRKRHRRGRQPRIWASLRQTIIVVMPPGPQGCARMLQRPALGSLKNSMPKRETQKFGLARMDRSLHQPREKRRCRCRHHEVQTVEGIAERSVAPIRERPDGRRVWWRATGPNRRGLGNETRHRLTTNIHLCRNDRHASIRTKLE